MKSKEIVYLVVAAVILSVAGYLAFTLLGPKGASSKEVTVEVVTPINAQFNQGAIDTLKDRTKAYDYYVRPDLSTGLNNAQPFGQ